MLFESLKYATSSDHGVLQREVDDSDVIVHSVTSSKYRWHCHLCHLVEEKNKMAIIDMSGL